MKLTNYKKSQVVMIYEDPVTQTKPEGKAVLFRKLREDTYTERWMVRFIGKYEHNVERSISRFPQTKEVKNNGKLCNE